MTREEQLEEIVADLVAWGKTVVGDPELQELLKRAKIVLTNDDRPRIDPAWELYDVRFVVGQWTLNLYGHEEVWIVALINEKEPDVIVGSVFLSQDKFLHGEALLRGIEEILSWSAYAGDDNKGVGTALRKLRESFNPRS